MEKVFGTKIEKWVRTRGASPLLGLLIGIVAVVAYWPGIFGYALGLPYSINLKPFATLDLRIGDMLQRSFKHPHLNADVPNICIVGKSEAHPGAETETQARAEHAQVIKNLATMGAAVIALDFDFAGETASDQELIDAISQSNRVLLSRRGMTTNPIPLTNVSDGAATGPSMAMALSADSPTRWSDGAYRIPLHPINPKIEAAALGVGHVNLFYDADLTARRAPAAIGDMRDSRAFIPLAVAALSTFQGYPASEFTFDEEFLRFGGNASIPLSVDGSIPLNFQPVSQLVDMRPYALRNIAEDSGSDAAPAPPIAFYNYDDVLKNVISRDAFKDAIVFVSECGSLDRQGMYITPIGSQYPVVLQAMLLHSIVTHQPLNPVKPFRMVLAIIAVSVLIGTLCFGVRVPGSGVQVLLSGVLFLAAGVALIFLGAGWLRYAGRIVETVPFLIVLGANIAVAIAVNAVRMSEEAQRRNREMELLLVAGRRHLAEFTPKESSSETAIPGSSFMAVSESLSKRTPDVVASTFWQTIPCEGCVLFILSDQTALSFSRVVFQGFTGDISKESAEAMAVRFAWEALKEGRTIVRARRGAAWLPAYAPDSLRSMMAVPVIARAQPMAVAVLINKTVTPASPDKEFTDNDLRLTAALRYQAAAMLENARRHQHEFAMFDGFARALAKAVDFRDRYTRGHSDRVARLSIGIAREIGLSKEEIEVVQRAAILHDLGKIGVSDVVLNKPGRLTSDEFSLIRAHAANGYDILAATPSFEALLPGIRHHHERYDGKGYPDGLAGEEIPLLARIIAAADAYDAMTSDRPYRRALPNARACHELITGSGTQFDPAIVRALMRYLQKRKNRRSAESHPSFVSQHIEAAETIDLPLPDPLASRPATA